MQFIRSLLFSITMIILVIIFGGFCAFFRFLPQKILHGSTRIFGKLITGAGKYICGMNYHVTGLENIPTDRPYVIFSKHQSTWETFFMHTLLPKYSTILKEELLRVPFFGWGLSALKPIAINRNDRRSAMGQIIAQGKDRISQGLSILCFPEGTRKSPGEEPDYKIGGAKLAESVGAPIIPVALNSGECWPRKSFLKHPGTISVIIGPAIETKDKKAKEILIESRDWIEIKMQEINFTAQKSLK